ncbi:unnamed protein product, partial [marine sediment metagenome]
CVICCGYCGGRIFEKENTAEISKAVKDES